MPAISSFLFPLLAQHLVFPFPHHSLAAPWPTIHGRVRSGFGAELDSQ